MPRVKTVSKKLVILEAAARVFAAKEFHQVLIDDVASEAGVGKGTIYRYFETKEDLYFDTVLDVLDHLERLLLATLPEETSPTRRLERVAREILQLAWQRRHLFTLLQADERRFFDRWTAKQRAAVNDQATVDRGGPPPTRDIPGQAFSSPPPLPHDIIGLFPEPGGSR